MKAAVEEFHPLPGLDGYHIVWGARHHSLQAVPELQSALLIVFGNGRQRQHQHTAVRGRHGPDLA